MSTKNVKENAGISIVEKIGGQRLIAAGALIVLVLIFSMFGNGFYTYPTLLNIMQLTYFLGFLSIGLTFVFAAGGMDISTGTGMMCIGLIGGVIFTKTGATNASMIAVIISCLVFGAILGAINGFLISYLEINPFIVTMAMQMITRGTGSIVTKIQSQTYPQQTDVGGWFRNIFVYKWEGMPRTISAGVPTGIILLLVIAVVMSIILNKTKIGRYTLAIGSNKEATRLSGVNTRKWELITYVISGLMAGIAALGYAAAYTTFTPGASDGYEMQAIAGMVIGGTSMSGGIASIAGTIIGVLIMSVLKAGLPTVGLQPHYQLVFTGIILIVAVFADVANRKRKGE